MSCRGHRSKNWVLINAKNKVGPKEYSRNSDESADSFIQAGAQYLHCGYSTI